MLAYPSTPMYSYPVVRALTFQTSISAGDDGTEQRWPLTPGQESWTLPHPNVTLAGRDALLAFFDSAKGSYDQTISFTFLGTTYTGCYLDTDRLSCTQRNQTRWALSVALRQVVRTPDAGVLPAAFPALASGNLVQLPYTHEREFRNVVVTTEGGRYVRNTHATVLRSWSAGGSVLSDADALAIWNQFSRARGRWGSFSFIDPDSHAVYTARFSSDSLEWRHMAPGHNAIETQIVQVP